MKFNQHFNLIGRHAMFSPSQYHWINYDEDKLVSRYYSFKAVEEGTELHDLASKLILHGVRLPKNKKTLNMYVNDAIGYKMTVEQPLYYSEYFFGTSDAICFDKKLLRIHDLKTGATPAHMEQLEIYAALFCLEYQVKPQDIEIELRLYQSDEVNVENPEPDLIQSIMDKIKLFDKVISTIEAGE